MMKLMVKRLKEQQICNKSIWVRSILLKHIDRNYGKNFLNDKLTREKALKSKKLAYGIHWSQMRRYKPIRKIYPLGGTPVPPSHRNERDSCRLPKMPLKQNIRSSRGVCRKHHMLRTNLKTDSSDGDTWENNRSYETFM